MSSGMKSGGKVQLSCLKVMLVFGDRIFLLMFSPCFYKQYEEDVVPGRNRPKRETCWSSIKFRKAETSWYLSVSVLHVKEWDFTS